MEIWSGRKFKATLHRVLLDGKEDRYSVPFFYETNLDLKIEPLTKNETKDGTHQDISVTQNITPAGMFLERLDMNKLRNFS